MVSRQPVQATPRVVRSRDLPRGEGDTRELGQQHPRSQDPRPLLPPADRDRDGGGTARERAAGGGGPGAGHAALRLDRHARLQRQPSEGKDSMAGWTTEPFQLLAHLEKMTVEAIFHLKDFTRHLEEPAALRQLREVARRFAKMRSTIVLTGKRCPRCPGRSPTTLSTSTCASPAPTSCGRCFATCCARWGRRRRCAWISVSRRRSACSRHSRASPSTRPVRRSRGAALRDGRLGLSDVSAILDRKAEVLREGRPPRVLPAEDNRFELGGFAGLKAWLKRARVGFTQRARELNLSPPRGILLLGVQGCGKSLSAKCIAREWELPLVKLEAGRLYDKYIGGDREELPPGHEARRDPGPVVLWIDELEKAFAPTGSGEADGGVSRRVFGAFLTWLQEKREEVFVVATANDLSSLPPRVASQGSFRRDLLRRPPGRRGASRDPGDPPARPASRTPGALELAPLVEGSDGMSGAEIEQAVISALYEALHVGTPLDTGMILDEIQATVPLSVSRREQIEALRRLGRQRFVPVR